MRSRRPLLPLVVFAAALLPVPASSQGGTVPVVVVEGKGFGHGVGMAQDGAYWMGRAGATTAQILGHFYPGTGLGRASGPVRVNVLSAGSRATLEFPRGGQVRDGRDGPTGEGFPVRVQPGGTVSVEWTGSRYVATPGPGANVASSTAASEAAAMGRPGPARPAQEQPPSSTTTTHPDPVPTTSTTAPEPEPGPVPPSSTTTTAPSPPPDPEPEPGPRREAVSTRPLFATSASGGTIGVPARSRAYRGIIEATAVGGPFRLVNEVDVETYLTGMGEVRNPSWPPASLRAQAIAARTYALRAMAAAGELCDTQRCQVYLGAHAEYAAMNKAVADSAGQVLTFGRTLASTVYSANGGGFSASREEGFGTSGAGYPYLRPAPYETRDPVPWSVTVSQRDVGARLGYGGEVTGLEVIQRGPSGRATEVAIDGTAGRKVVNGISFDAALGLKSTLFSLRLDVADTAPPPPPPSELQALPDDAAAFSLRTEAILPAESFDGDEGAAGPEGDGGLITGVALLGLVLQGLAFMAIPGAARLSGARSPGATPPPEPVARPPVDGSE